VSTRKELSQARKAIARDRGDEALVILWNLVEPARLEDDQGTLRAIAAIAGAVAQKDESSRREAERLLETLGRATPARPEPERAEIGFEELDEPLPSMPPTVPSIPSSVEDAGYGDIEAPETATERAETDPQPRRRGPGRFVIPIVTLVVILVNVIARVLRD